MTGKLAARLFLAVCVVLAILMLMQTIKPVVGGLLFAIALVVLGGLSRGFRTLPRPPR